MLVPGRDLLNSTSGWMANTACRQLVNVALTRLLCAKRFKGQHVSHLEMLSANVTPSYASGNSIEFMNSCRNTNRSVLNILILAILKLRYQLEFLSMAIYPTRKKTARMYRRLACSKLSSRLEAEHCVNYATLR